MQPLSGPRTQGAASTESVKGKIQTVSSPFGLWRWRFVLPFSHGRELRQIRGLIGALHGGANAVVVDFNDPDRSAQESALPSFGRVPWGNGKPWGNGRDWTCAPPHVRVAEAAALGATVVKLEQTHWSPYLGFGAWLGFAPYHLALYLVTEIRRDGRLRIWPPLRRAITTDVFGTLRPKMAMKLESEDGAVWKRDHKGAKDTTLIMVEVEDRIVRSVFRR